MFFLHSSTTTDAQAGPSHPTDMVERLSTESVPQPLSQGNLGTTMVILHKPIKKNKKGAC